MVRLGFVLFSSIIESLFNQKLMKDLCVFIGHFCKSFTSFVGRESKFCDIDSWSGKRPAFIIFLRQK